jgi:hypothetical protein
MHLELTASELGRLALLAFQLRGLITSGSNCVGAARFSRRSLGCLFEEFRFVCGAAPKV